MSFNDFTPETGIGVKKANQEDLISNDEFERRICAIAHAKRDIVWWAENFFNIINLDSGLQLIKLYDRQKQMLQHLVDNNRSIVLAARQTGKTTTYTVFCLWLTTLFTEKKVMICANKLQTAIEIMDRLRRAYEQLPFWIKPGILTYNKGEIKFANMSSIMAFSTSSSGARGQSGNVIIIDEMAFIPKNIIDDFFASVMPVISSSKNSKAIVVSTPNGASGLYYDLWKQANSKDKSANKDGWTPFRINWWETGGIRDERWKAQQIATVGIDRWRQEFECDFLASSSDKKLVPEEVLEKYRMKLSEYKTKNIEPKHQRIISQDQTEQYEFLMWHEFRPNRTYMASGDVAEGVGGDSSVLYIWDVTDLRNIVMCAKFSSNSVSLVQFAYIARKILALYNDPYLFCERNGVSAGMLDSLRITYGYSNIAIENKKHEPGIYSHIQVKGKACLWARDMLTMEGFGFTIYDKELLDDFEVFVKKDTKGVHQVYQALPGPNSHDDHIMAFIWGCYAIHNDVVNNYFQVCEIFTTALDQTYARTLKPYHAYIIDDIQKLQNDPLYKDFIEFKNESSTKLRTMLELERQDISNDSFKYRRHDAYFGDISEDDWSNTPLNWNMHQNQNIANQAFSLGNAMHQPSFFVL